MICVVLVSILFALTFSAVVVHLPWHRLRRQLQNLRYRVSILISRAYTNTDHEECADVIHSNQHDFVQPRLIISSLSLEIPPYASRSSGDDKSNLCCYTTLFNSKCKYPKYT